MHIDHIGIAVKDLSSSDNLFSKLLNTSPFKHETLEHQKVEVSFFQTGESKLELLQGIGEDSPISKFIEKKGEGIHHIAFLVEDIYTEIDRMKNEGFEPLQESPRLGADQKLVFFFHPKTTNGVLIELCQKQSKP
jgi:methylmalonyl-CoA/ethylmalonyl-CoA epimerase